jgi:hypothetical protein
MARLLLDEENAPSAPAAGKSYLYPDAVTDSLTERSSTRARVIGGVRNQSVAVQAYTTAEIYLTGSSLIVPTHLLQAGATFYWRVVLTKTAGTAVPVFTVRIGTLGTTGDASICAFTGFAGATSATDTAWVDILGIIRTTGAAATSEWAIRATHALDITGFANLRSIDERKDGSTFNSTAASLIVGATFNHGTAGAGNIEMVTAELVNG